MDVFRQKLPAARGPLRTILLLLRIAAWFVAVAGAVVVAAVPLVVRTLPEALAGAAIGFALTLAGLAWTEALASQIRRGDPRAGGNLTSYAVTALVVGIAHWPLLVVGILLLVQRSAWEDACAPATRHAGAT